MSRASALIGDLPRHHYVYVDKAFLSAGEVDGWIKASWFGLVSVPNRAWGATVLLENGAVYTPLPLHALSFKRDTVPWEVDQSQRWDCFGVDFATVEYAQLAEREMHVYVRPGEWHDAVYLFTAQHYGDAYSLTPSQTKQYHFARLDNGRIASLPTNCCVFHDPAFTVVGEKPTWLRVNEHVYACEPSNPWDDTITETTG